MPTTPIGGEAGPQRGVGSRKVHTARTSVSDGGTYDTGLDSIDHAIVSAANNDAGTTLNLDSVASISGGTITFDCATVDGTANGAANASAHNVDVIAIGEVN